MMDVTLEHCQQIVEKAISESATCFEFEVTPYSDEVIGYMGDHFKLVMKVRHEDEDVVSTHHFFVKTLPTQPKKFEQYIKELGIFEKEASFYKDVLPIMKVLKETPFAPECYMCTDTFIILEDLKRKGFNVCREYFEYDQWDPALKALAKLHASSIICEEKNSAAEVKYRLNDEFPSAFKETTFVFDVAHPRGKWLRNCAKAVIDCLQLFCGCNQRIEVCSRMLKYLFQKLPEHVAPSRKYRNVVTHADLWKNNVLFRLAECEYKEAILVDFQLIRYVPPVFDLLTMIYLNSDKDFLFNNFDALLNMYYAYFSTFLKMRSVDPDEILPIKEFLKTVEEYKMAAILEATFFGTIVFISDELSKSLSENDEVFEEFTYINRTKYILQEYRENYRFKQKFDTLLKRLVDITLNLKMDF